MKFGILRKHSVMTEIHSSVNFIFIQLMYYHLLTEVEIMIFNINIGGSSHYTHQQFLLQTVWLMTVSYSSKINFSKSFSSRYTTYSMKSFNYFLQMFREIFHSKFFVLYENYFQPLRNNCFYFSCKISKIHQIVLNLKHN